jgi:hypothetical protein
VPEGDRTPEVPQRGVEIVQADRRKTEGPFRNRDDRGVALAQGTAGDRGPERDRAAWIDVCQTKRLARLLHGHGTHWKRPNDANRRG